MTRGIPAKSAKAPDHEAREERLFWEGLKKEGSEVELRYARDLPDDAPAFIIRHLMEFEEEVSRFCFEGGKGLVLDAGCGNGNLLMHALRIYPDSIFDYVGIDFSRNMLDRAAARTRGMNRVHFIQGGLASLPFRDGSFDHLISSGVLTCLSSMDEAEASLAEFGRVLSFGGILAVDFFNNRSPTTLMRRLCGERMDPPEYISPKAFRGLLEDAGFKPFSAKGFDFKPCQGYLFMSRLRLFDPCFIQERFSRIVEAAIQPRIPALSRFGYRIYVRSKKDSA